MKTNDLTSELVQKILQDPLLLQKLSDRVYHLLLEDLRNQLDRIQSP